MIISPTQEPHNVLQLLIEKLLHHVLNGRALSEKTVRATQANWPKRKNKHAEDRLRISLDPSSSEYFA